MPDYEIFIPSFAYSRNQVLLEDIHLSLDRGKSLSILGPSGAGKSTLLRILAGLERKEGHQLTWPETEIVMVFQGDDLFPGTVEHNLRFGFRKDRTRGRELKRKMEDLLGRFRLSPEFLYRRIDTLSGGERQRLSLARAFAFRPKILLLDEPFANMDTHARIDAIDFLAELRAEFGTSAIVVTHQPDDAFISGDKIGVLCGVPFSLTYPRRLKTYLTPSDAYWDLTYPGAILFDALYTINVPRRETTILCRPWSFAEANGQPADLTVVVENVLSMNTFYELAVRFGTQLLRLRLHQLSESVTKGAILNLVLLAGRWKPVDSSAQA